MSHYRNSRTSCFDCACTPETLADTSPPSTVSLLQRTRLINISRTTSESPDTIPNSQTISHSIVTQTTEARCDSASTPLNGTHTDTGLGKASSMNRDPGTTTYDVVYAHSVQQQNSAIGTDADFAMGSMVDVSVGWRVALERELGGASSESAGNQSYCVIHYTC